MNIFTSLGKIGRTVNPSNANPKKYIPILTQSKNSAVDIILNNK